MSKPPHPAIKCKGTVQECVDCKWRGGNYVDKPCHKCGGEVLRRPCRQYSIKGGMVCKTHGGATEHVRAQANQHLELMKIEQTIAKGGFRATKNVTPQMALQQSLNQSYAVCEYLAQVVDSNVRLEGGLTADSKYWQVVKLLNQERDRQDKVAKMMLDADVAERVTKVKEDHAELLAQAFESVMQDPEVGLTGPQQAAMRASAARALRAVRGEDLAS